MGDIHVTDLHLGDDFPIFSNCRVVPVDGAGQPMAAADAGARTLHARMDVDLSDVVTLAVDTSLVLHYPKPRAAVLPVALSISVVRFSGTLSLSFAPQATSPSPPQSSSTSTDASPATTLTFAFLPDYRLDLSVRSLLGSRSRLQDVPKIARLIQDRVHHWFDDRCVEPRFQKIVIPSLWPRSKTTHGGDAEVDATPAPATNPTPASHTNTERRTADWAASQRSTGAEQNPQTSGPDTEPSTETIRVTDEMLRAGEAMRRAEAGAGAGATTRRDRELRRRVA